MYSRSNQREMWPRSICYWFAMLRKVRNQVQIPWSSVHGENGVANAWVIRSINEYNYVITLIVSVGDQSMIKLDASQPYNGFNQLPTDYVTKMDGGIFVNENKAVSRSISSVWFFTRNEHHQCSLYFNDDKGKSSGTFKSVLGKNESYNVKERLGNSSEKTYEKRNFRRGDRPGSDSYLVILEIDSLKKFDFPYNRSIWFRFDKPPTADNIVF